MATNGFLHGKSVFVTGASGLIGYRLSETWTAAGAKVTVLNRGPGEVPPGVTTITGRLEEPAGWLQGFRHARPQVVVHLACSPPPARARDQLDQAIGTNLEGTRHLLDAALDAKSEIFLNTGTCEEYGQNVPPFSEDQVPDPRSAYALSKTLGADLGRYYANTHGLPVVTLRLFTTYGPRQRPHMLVGSILDQALRGGPIRTTAGEQTREMLYVDDVVRAFQLAAERPELAGHVVNVGDGREHKIRDVMNRIVELFGFEGEVQFGALPYRPHEIWRLYSSTKKVQAALGWRPETDLEEGLTRTVEWFKKRTPSKPT